MEEIGLFIENKWGLSNVTITKLLQSNGGRKVYLINAMEGAYVLKIFHPELTLNEIRRYTDVLLFLESTDLGYAPKIVRLLDDSVYTSIEGSYLYLMEYIQGQELSETPDDEFKLGITLAKLHNIEGYTHNSNTDSSKRINNMLRRFKEYPFKEEYDHIVNNLPDFTTLKQSFIHTDICPKNARVRNNGDIVLIDYDDAGNGSTYIDLGYPLITQFVQFEDRIPGQHPPDINKLHFKYEIAKAFYQGYFSIAPMSNTEKQFIFDGAVFMQLMYMPCFGDEAVPYLWKQLSFAIENKSLLMNSLEE